MQSTGKIPTSLGCAVPRRLASHQCAASSDRQCATTSNSPSILQRATARSAQHAPSERKNPELYRSDVLLLPSPLPPGASQHACPAAQAPYAPSRRPEVLAPAGGWPQLRAAVEGGADAVYFGVTDLNARARAANFAPNELPGVMSYLHERGVKGYQVVNVLVFDDELQLVARRAQEAAAAGVDAVIVQDVGAVGLVRAVAPGLEVHGSTQMTVTSAEGAEFAASLGCERVVVGRELSVGDIATVAAAGCVEVEAFVHGALCVSYSGQCFSSEAWGGRSANRGQCAQACRLDYGMLVDGKLQYLGDVKYLLSPQDLAAVELVPQMMRAGVMSFKIEGRLKGPEYVALTTGVYRRAVDAAWVALAAERAATGGEAPSPSGGAPPPHRLSEAQWQELAQVFARGQDAAHTGLTPGFLGGPRHQELVRGRAPRHRGVYLGEVESVGGGAGSARVRLAAPLRLGDGVVFDRGDPQAEEQGGAVYAIRVVDSGATNSGGGGGGGSMAREPPASGGGRSGAARGRGGGGVGGGGPAAGAACGGAVREAAKGSLVDVEFARGRVAWGEVAPGQLLWKNKDPGLDARLRAAYDGLPAAQRRRLPVAVAVAAAPGAPLRISLTDAQGRRGSGQTDCLVEAAAGRALGAGDLERAIGRHLGDQGSFVVSALDLSACELAAAPLFVPPAAVKEARRRAVAALLDQQRAVPMLPASPAEHIVKGMLAAVRGSSRRAGGDDDDANAAAAAPMLRVLCRTRAQVDAALALPWLGELVLDFLEVHGLREATAAVQAAGRRVVVATPRVLKPGDRSLWTFYLRLGADGLLLRSAGLLHQLAALGGPGTLVPGCDDRPIPPLDGDFSLNAANALSADLMLRRGLRRLAPTHDCDAAQLRGMARALGPRAAQLEAILHTNLPVFHTEHCVFARFLSDGNSFLDCGHPCERHTLHLRDPNGRDHLVLADQGCRNTVFEGAAQSALPFLPGLVAAGYGCFRVELVDQPAGVVGPLLERYRAALDDAAAAAQGAASPREAGARQQELWRWLQGLPDANGRMHGTGLGSLEVRAERGLAGMKQTAAAQRAGRGGGGGGPASGAVRGGALEVL